METEKPEITSEAEQARIQPQTIDNSASNYITTKLKPDERLWRTCPKCKHKWLGVPTSDKCPKCKKFIGKPKGIKEVKGLDGIKVEKVNEKIPELPLTDAPGAPTIADVPSETYLNVISICFDTIAKFRKKDCWKLTDNEKKSLEPLLKKVGDKWIGKWFDKYPEEAALAIVASMIILGKVALDYQEKQKSQEVKT